MQSVKVWDPLIRILHWGTAVLFLLDALVFGESETHDAIGYILFALIIIRVLWGFVGSEYSRFSAFWPSMAAIKDHVRGFFSGKTQQYLTLNPLGAVMVINLLVTMVLISITGIMMEPWAFDTLDAIEGVHVALSDYAFICVALHVLGATIQSLRTKSKLVKAMITGRKEIDDPGT